MEHVLHLAAKAVIETVCPAPSSFSKKRKTTVEDVNEDEDDGLDEEWMYDDDELEAGVAEPDVIDFDTGDVLSKLLALINQVRWMVTY